MKSIDLDKLNESLQNQILEDKKYWERNDAKLRAVGQRVGTYEEFRQMVLGAHLRPLNKDEKISELKRGPRRWNLVAENGGNEETMESTVKGQNIENISHFMTHWKNCKNVEDRANLLIDLGAQRLGRFFSSDLRFDFFDEAVVALSHVDGRTEDVMNILAALAQCRGFSLVINFMSSESRSCLKSLFDKLYEHPSEGESLKRLIGQYFPQNSK